MNLKKKKKGQHPKKLALTDGVPLEQKKRSIPPPSKILRQAH